MSGSSMQPWESELLNIKKVKSLEGRKKYDQKVHGANFKKGRFK